MDYLTVENSILLAIRPENAKKIYSKQKRYELRKSAPRKHTTIAFLYETANIQAITGFIVIKDILTCALKELWNKMDRKKKDNINFDGYFINHQNGSALEIGDSFRFEQTIHLKTIKELQPFFKVPQNFLYLNTGSKLAERLSQALFDFLWNFSKPVKLQKISRKEHREFRSLVKKIIGRYYDEIDETFADHLIESTELDFDRFGYFTKKKNVFSITLNNKKIGYTTITEKIGGSVKTGPTILYENYRNKGYGQKLRYHIENLYKLKNFRKIYCTCPDTNTQGYKYLIKSGYKVEAHLIRQYSETRNELIFGKLLRTDRKKSYGIIRNNKRIIRITNRIVDSMGLSKFLIKNFPLFYMEIDDRFVISLLDTLKRRDVHEYYGKPKKVFCGYSNNRLVSVIITSPKRGGSVRLTSIIMTKDVDSFGKILNSVERYYKSAKKRKLYVTVPVFDDFAISSFQNFGYKIEGVLREPYRDGVDLFHIGKFI